MPSVFCLFMFLKCFLGVMVIIARFQWVGVLASTGNRESTDQSDASTAAAAANDDDEVTSSPCMQYFIQV